MSGTLDSRAHSSLIFARSPWLATFQVHGTCLESVIRCLHSHWRHRERARWWKSENSYTALRDETTAFVSIELPTDWLTDLLTEIASRTRASRLPQWMNQEIERCTTYYTQPGRRVEKFIQSAVCGCITAILVHADKRDKPGNVMESMRKEMNVIYSSYYCCISEEGNWFTRNSAMQYSNSDLKWPSLWIKLYHPFLW